MGRNNVELMIPVLIKKGGKEIICPFFNKRFELTLDREEIQDISLSLQADLPANELTEVQALYVKKLSKLVETLYECAVEEYRRTSQLRTPLKEREYNIKQDIGDVWLTYTLNIEVEKGFLETALPILTLSSAVIATALGICAAGISIYIKGLSVPITLTLSLATAITTLINFTQSDTSSYLSRIGRYIDHVSPRRSLQDISSFKNNKILIGSGLLFAMIWGTTLTAEVISYFSTTEIIDKAGREKGLEFMSNSLIFYHALFYALLAGITYATYSGNFSIKAAINLTEWLQAKISHCQEDNIARSNLEDADLEAGRTPLLSHRI